MPENTANHSLPMISVIIPVKNEEQHVATCLESIIHQDYPRELMEVIVVDGGSIDSSVEIVHKIADKHPRIKLMGGPGVNCPAAMNVGIKHAKGELISKIDAHGYVASDFLKMSVKHLSMDEDIKCVGGPIRAVAETHIARANAFARSSIFGVGKGVYSIEDRPIYVDTVQCGVYKKHVFQEVGLFDESLQFGEDEEVNWRIRKTGHKIFLTPEMRFFYFVRNSFGKLFRQYYNYGRARVKVIQKHPDFLSIKHVVPTTLIVALSLTGILAILSSLFIRPFLGIAFAYLALSLGFSVLTSMKEGCWKYVGLLPISFAALHFGYGIGFGRGIVGLCAPDRILRSKSKVII